MLALSLCSPGCALICDGVQTVCTSVGDAVDDTLECIRNRKWADAAWAEVCAGEPHDYSDDYAAGFRDGFTTYLFRGGDGEPPPVAPAKYRKFRYQTPHGYKAIEDWFAGYRHGATVARASNYRSLITGPLASSAPVGPLLNPVLTDGHGAALIGPAMAVVPAAGPPREPFVSPAPRGAASPYHVLPGVFPVAADAPYDVLPRAILLAADAAGAAATPPAETAPPPRIGMPAAVGEDTDPAPPEDLPAPRIGTPEPQEQPPG
jgi:hypothetical protein